MAPGAGDAAPAPARTPLDWDWLRFLSWSAAGFFALVVVLRVLLPAAVPFGVLTFGVVIGCINALIAVALILVYKSNRIINFAQAEIGIFGAILFENLIRGPGVPWALALVLGVAGSALLGGLLEVTLIRRFFKAPRLIVTVVTIGMAQVVVVLTYLLARSFGEVAASGKFRTPFSGIDVVITGVHFSGDALVLVASVPIMIVALNQFLRRTDFGIAIRASAEAGERAALLGVPVRRVSTVMWVTAAGLTALATILRAPVVGLISGSSVQGPGLLLRALAAAVLARMENLRVAVVVAVLIGVVEQALYFTYNGSTISDVVFVALIVGGLLFQRRSTTRFEEGDTSSWTAVEEVRPVPRELRSLPEVRWAKVVIGVVLASAVVAVGLVATPSRANLFSAMAIYAIVAVSLVVLTGWAGQISLGQFGIVGFGAAVAGRLVADAGADFFLAMAAGIIAGAAVALVLGLAALRIKGFFFAVSSLGFAVAVQTFFLNDQYFDLLTPVNRPERPILLDRFDLEDERAFLFFSIAVLLVVISCVGRLRRSRTGRVLTAVRDNERAAQAYAIDHVKARLLAFALSGGIAGLAGSLLAVHQHAVQASAFSANESLRVFSMVVIGGLGSIPGAILGAVFVRGASFLLSAQFAVLATGAGLLLVLLLLPGGLGRVLYQMRDFGLRWIAARRGIVAPSLLADVRQADPTAAAVAPALQREAAPIELVSDGQPGREREPVA